MLIRRHFGADVAFQEALKGLEFNNFKFGHHYLSNHNLDKMHAYFFLLCKGDRTVNHAQVL